MIFEIFPVQLGCEQKPASRTRPFDISTSFPSLMTPYVLHVKQKPWTGASVMMLGQWPCSKKFLGRNVENGLQPPCFALKIMKNWKCLIMLQRKTMGCGLVTQKIAVGQRTSKARSAHNPPYASSRVTEKSRFGPSKAPTSGGPERRCSKASCSPMAASMFSEMDFQAA